MPPDNLPIKPVEIRQVTDWSDPGLYNFPKCMMRNLGVYNHSKSDFRQISYTICTLSQVRGRAKVWFRVSVIIRLPGRKITAYQRYLQSVGRWIDLLLDWLGFSVTCMHSCVLRLSKRCIICKRVPTVSNSGQLLSIDQKFKFCFTIRRCNAICSLLYQFLLKFRGLPFQSASGAKPQSIKQ